MTGTEFDELRPLLFSIAYRMLSSVAEAEDIVQDSFLRYQKALEHNADIHSLKSYLSAVVTRLAIDRLRSANKRRETYVGEWLPEPLLTSDDDPALSAESRDTLSMAFLRVLDRLTPVERAIFLLHDVFEYEYDEVAAIVRKNEENCRKIAERARRHVKQQRPRFEVSHEHGKELASQFFTALRSGDVDDLASMLAADVVVYGDGGGKVPQWMHPISGIDAVRKLLAGLSRQIAALGITIEPRQINGQPGAIFRSGASVTNIFVLEISDGVVRAILSVINPEKLRHLGKVADVRELAREAQRMLRSMH